MDAFHSTKLGALLPFRVDRSVSAIWLYLPFLLLGVLASTGCQRWPGGLQAQKFQSDSERLLNEFRAEKKRADDLAAKNQLLEQRLAETEKDIARRNLAGNRGRTKSGSDARLTIGAPSGPHLNGLSHANTSRNGSSRPNFIEGGGLPDMRPGTSGQFTSTGLDHSLESERESQWRPIHK